MTEPIREHLVRLLDWEDAHVTFDRVVEAMPPEAHGLRPANFAHSAWQLLEHIRVAQDDILEFCVNPGYVHNLSWPDDYWPQQPAPPSPAAWSESVAAYRSSRDRLKRLARDVTDLTALVPTGTGTQTYLRALLLAADHTAYHVGQIVALRRALGVWPGA